MNRALWLVAALSAPLIWSAAAPAEAQQRPGRPVAPVRPGDQNLRPIAPQSTLPVLSFTSGNVQCARGLDRATARINVRLGMTPGASTTARAQIETLVNGVSAGRRSLAINNGAVAFSQDITLPGGAGEHQVVFVLDGRVRSEPQTVTHQCVRGTNMAPNTGGLMLPNLAFGNILYAELDPNRPPPQIHTYLGQSGPVSLGTPVDMVNPVVVRDLLTNNGRIQFRRNTQCPVEQDAWVTARFVIALDPTRISDPQNHVVAPGHPFPLEVGLLDTVDGARYSNGTEVGDEQMGSRRLIGTPMPAGHVWLILRTPLRCTRDGVLELRFDPENRMRESNEGDNVLRIRYSTVAR